VGGVESAFVPGRIHVEKEGALGWLIFDHPERRNAISHEMWEALPRAAQALGDDPELRVVLLRGAGEISFVSGADISEFEGRRTGGDAAAAYEEATGRAFGALASLNKPVIAMIHGFCVGGGMATALAADLRYAADDAVFAIPAARLGLAYHPGGIEALEVLVGPSAAKEILFSARRYTAAEAKALGLVNRVFPKAALEQEVRSIAAEIAANAPLTIRSVKTLVRELGKDGHTRDRAAMSESIRRCFESADYKEGVRAFLEKRAPRFQGH